MLFSDLLLGNSESAHTTIYVDMGDGTRCGMRLPGLLADMGCSTIVAHIRSMEKGERIPARIRGEQVDNRLDISRTKATQIVRRAFARKIS